MKAFIARVSNLLLSPKTEWDIIDKEAATPRKLALGYVAPLAIIPVIAVIVGLAVVGVEVNGSQYRAPILEVVAAAALLYALAILGVFVFAHVVNWIAPRFGAERSYTQAFKLSAYSITAAMIAAVLAIIPQLGIFTLLGASYSLYLLFVGAPKVMHAAEKSAVNYSIVATIAALVMALAAGFATMAVASPTGKLLPQLARLPDFVAGEREPPPSAPLELGSTPLPAEAGVLAPGAPATASGGDLRGVTPLKLAGLDRVAVGVERSGLPGSRTVEVEAEYRKGRRYLSLQIIYSTTMGQELGFAGTTASEFDRETTDGYARRRRVGDAIVVEDWNNTSRSGSYGRLVEDRYYVKASGGDGVSARELREVVELFGRQTLAQLEAQS